ncbi:hypothetical protein IVA80_31015 [Bradyrhizobium sp. 139]|nr:hypothetical protein [Bradyrhizobium sp. 139]
MLGPAPPPACIHYFEPFDLGTAPITVHKDSSQQHASLGKAAFTGRIPWSPVLRRNTRREEVARGIDLDNRIGTKFLHADRGFSGSRFPKDIKALTKIAQDMT